jgi:hypothetical protein
MMLFNTQKGDDRHADADPPVVISMLCCGPSEVIVANEVLDGTKMIGQLLGEG